MTPIEQGGRFAGFVAGVTIGREEARDAAERELRKGIYHRDDPSPLTRALSQLVDWLQGLLQGAATVAPGGWAGLLGLLLLLVLGIVGVRLRIGPIAGRHTRPEPLLGDTILSARQHRMLAEERAADGRWAEAVRERLRAVARELEERAILEARPGRTARELAAEAGDALPARAEELTAAGDVFDEIWYGNRPATREHYERFGALDERIRHERPARAEAPA